MLEGEHPVSLSPAPFLARFPQGLTAAVAKPPKQPETPLNFVRVTAIRFRELLSLRHGAWPTSRLRSQTDRHFDSLLSDVESAGDTKAAIAFGQEIQSLRQPLSFLPFLQLLQAKGGSEMSLHNREISINRQTSCDRQTIAKSPATL